MIPRAELQAIAGRALFEVLAGAVAEHLAGRPVRVIWGDPKRGRNGTCARVGSTAVLTLRKSLSEADALAVLLHEAAHARLHHSEQADHARPAEVQAAALADPVAVAQVKARHEVEADALAAVWARWAAERATTPVGCLVALLSWRP